MTKNRALTEIHGEAALTENRALMSFMKKTAV
jgi:hypothetical protein